jgi:membrane-bound serine protease (ClpP class)
MGSRALPAFLLVAAIAMSPVAFAQQHAPVVDILEVSGVIDPSIAKVIAAEIDAANRRSAELLVIGISSPGGLNVSSESLVRRIVSSRIPVAVFVGPQRARAGGTAALLAAAAHVSAIGPSARLGPAFPSNLAVDPRSSRGRALLERERSLLRDLAGLRGRGDPEVFLRRSIPASRAGEAGVVDVTAVGIADLLQRINGRVVVTTAGERALRLDKDLVDIRFHKPGPVRRLLQTLANPALVYILLLAGAMLVVFEVFQPGFGVAGVSGAILLAGAVYGLNVLPAALWAVALVAAGLGLLTLDVAVHGLGVPTGAGMLGVVVGSGGLFPAPAGELGIPWWLVGVGSACCLAFFVPVMTMVRRARRPVSKGATRALVGRTGQVRSQLNPEGYVWVAEALWRARAERDERIRVGEDVQVTGVEGTLLTVRRA